MSQQRPAAALLCAARGARRPLGSAARGGGHAAGLGAGSLPAQEGIESAFIYFILFIHLLPAKCGNPVLQNGECLQETHLEDTVGSCRLLVAAGVQALPAASVGDWALFLLVHRQQKPGRQRGCAPAWSKKRRSDAGSTNSVNLCGIQSSPQLGRKATHAAKWASCRNSFSSHRLCEQLPITHLGSRSG